MLIHLTFEVETSLVPFRNTLVSGSSRRFQKEPGVSDQGEPIPSVGTVGRHFGRCSERAGLLSEDGNDPGAAQVKLVGLADFYRSQPIFNRPFPPCTVGRLYSSLQVARTVLRLTRKALAGDQQAIRYIYRRKKAAFFLNLQVRGRGL